MARGEINRSGEMEVFVRVVEQGGFSAAARASRMTPSAVSKLVARLEARLGSRLVTRSTRRLELTPEGCAFYERAARILADIEEAERSAGAGERPAGRIRISTSASYGAHVLAPLLPDFLARHPGVSLDIVETDTVIDLLAERVDVAIRAGELKASSLLARRLGDTGKVIVAAPAYLAQAGMPRRAADLDAHVRIGFGYARAAEDWPLREDGREVTLPPSARVQASDGEGVRRLAVAGVGLARLATFTVRADIAAGRLVPVLEALNPGDRESFHAVHPGSGGPLPARVRALIDFLAERGRVT
ncbi:LysR family transcriptional regulator [Ancylobacter sonchi]|uniref:LysR family transcriptional regulator n=1 Tax=Ancylobacter sonchi TaxID=1937790 RepID=UPI001BD36D3F|nr:LysR family transcriptional regulator [Ancylobacter sonchi]MBS7534876.1 LysR family transcriptional regulator [Ancylobacter sonchi]